MTLKTRHLNGAGKDPEDPLVIPEENASNDHIKSINEI